MMFIKSLLKVGTTRLAETKKKNKKKTSYLGLNRNYAKLCKHYVKFLISSCFTDPFLWLKH